VPVAYDAAVDQSDQRGGRLLLQQRRSFRVVLERSAGPAPVTDGMGRN
jgi:hypothetical protein